MIANVLALTVFALTALILVSPQLRRQDSWRATVTPLASIIGSGFLISLPLMADEFGAAAPLAMAALIAASYLLGAVIRFNIRHGEPLFDGNKESFAGRMERVSHLLLAGAYFISVTYYFSLLGAFSLKAVFTEGAAEHALLARMLVTILLVALGSWGAHKGLRGLENLEEFAVGLKLAVIAAVLAGLAAFNIDLIVRSDWHIGADVQPVDIHAIRVALGMLIIVQGFETSRFLKGAYSAELRIRTMRWAQGISAAIYCAFFLLSLVILDRAPRNGDSAAITDMMIVVASVLPALLIAGAAFAQLSAAVADAIGAAGLLDQTTAGGIKTRIAYPLIAGVGIVLIWTTDIFQIISLASRAFALYYALQCTVALAVALHTKGIAHRIVLVVAFSALGIFALAVVLFGLPAEPAG